MAKDGRASGEGGGPCGEGIMGMIHVNLRRLIPFGIESTNRDIEVQLLYRGFLGQYNMRVRACTYIPHPCAPRFLQARSRLVLLTSPSNRISLFATGYGISHEPTRLRSDIRTHHAKFPLMPRKLSISRASSQYHQALPTNKRRENFTPVPIMPCSTR